MITLNKKNIMHAINIMLLSLLMVCISAPTNTNILTSSSFKYILLVVILIVSFITNGLRVSSLDFNYTLVFAWLVFCSFCLISSSITGYTLKEPISYCVIVFSYYYLFPRVGVSINDFSISLIITGLLITLASLLNGNINYTDYQGVYSNTNTMGINMLSFSLAGFYITSTSDNIRYRFFSLISTILFMIQLILSGSRTTALSLLVFMILYLISYRWISKYFNGTGYNNESRRHNKHYVRNIIIILITIIIILFNYRTLYSIIYDFIYKWGNNTDDLTSNRSVMWAYILRNPTIWGHNNAIIQCHNDFFLRMYIFGIPAFISMIVFYLLAIYYSIKNIGQSKNKISIYIFAIIVSMIIVMSFEEIFGLFGKTIFIFGTFAIGCLINGESELNNS